MKTDGATKANAPEKTQCFFGDAWFRQRCFTSKITRPGLEDCAGNTGETAHSENGGHPGGHFESDSDSVASLKRQALDDLQRAWKALRQLEDLSDDQAESQAAGRAVAFVDKAFAQVEGVGTFKATSGKRVRKARFES